MRSLIAIALAATFIVGDASAQALPQRPSSSMPTPPRATMGDASNRAAVMAQADYDQLKSQVATLTNDVIELKKKLSVLTDAYNKHTHSIDNVIPVQALNIYTPSGGHLFKGQGDQNFQVLTAPLNKSVQTKPTGATVP